MYAIKIFRKDLLVHAYFIKKEWSEEIFSYEIVFKKSKVFLFKWSAKRWVKNNLFDDTLSNDRMEIING